MMSQAPDLAAEVLDLPAPERARLLELLIASFEPQSSAQKAWMDLARHRRSEVENGSVAMVSGTQALERVRARLA